MKASSGSSRGRPGKGPAPRRTVLADVSHLERDDLAVGMGRPLDGDLRRLAVDSDTFRQILGAFPSGVTIVTGRDLSGTPVGLTVTAVASVSLEPPELLVCLASTTYTLQALGHTGRFAVNILAAGQADLSSRFASRMVDKFDGVDWRAGRITGAPILGGCLAFAECEVELVVPSGDHAIVIGRIVEGQARPGSPLMYHDRKYAAWPEQ